MRRRGLWACLIILGMLAGVVVTMLSRSWTTPAKAAAAPAPAPIDAARAYGYLKAICGLGPRPAGSAANTRQRAMVAAHFKKMGAAVREQPFEANDPRTGAKVAMANLIGAWYPERTQRVVLGAHYDTRPFPDQERDPTRRSLPFLGANDGASGVALLMEIAHHLDGLPTPWGVDLILFDGEELVYGQEGEYFLGSKAFARAYDESVRSRRATSRYVAALVLDMVGDRNLQIDQEQHSYNFTFNLVQEVWGVARRLKATAFRNRIGMAVNDDHLPLIEAGIPAIDLIDFDYPYWHTTRDLPEQCSGESLAQVGRVVTAWLAQPRPLQR
ncbi:MAG: M28 family peptidase [Planctomycetaceae bacterium]|nr:M28 family peptidase [Planctomycetaceae bacterium]